MIVVIAEDSVLLKKASLDIDIPSADWRGNLSQILIDVKLFLWTTFYGLFKNLQKHLSHILISHE